MSFWDFFWLMVWGFFFVMYLMILFKIIADIFRNKTTNGLVKAVWLIVLLVIPVITAIVYIVTQGDGMYEREAALYAEQRSAAEARIRAVSGTTDSATQIANAKALLDSGAITQDEFTQLKAKALA